MDGGSDTSKKCEAEKHLKEGKNKNVLRSFFFRRKEKKRNLFCFFPLPLSYGKRREDHPRKMPDGWGQLQVPVPPIEPSQAAAAGLPAFQSNSMYAQQPPGLPQGWEMKLTPDGQTYFEVWICIVNTAGGTAAVNSRSSSSSSIFSNTMIFASSHHTSLATVLSFPISAESSHQIDPMEPARAKRAAPWVSGIVF